MPAQVPITTRSYYFPALGSYNNLTLQTTPLPALKSTFVLIKIHAVSLQYRDLMIASNKYPRGGIPEKLVPCSDMAGDVVSVGSDVTRWTFGDRVCANFTTDHLDGDITAELGKSALGGGQHGVLTEYRDFPIQSIGYEGYPFGHAPWATIRLEIFRGMYFFCVRAPRIKLANNVQIQ